MKRVSMKNRFSKLATTLKLKRRGKQQATVSSNDLVNTTINLQRLLSFSPDLATKIENVEQLLKDSSFYLNEIQRTFNEEQFDIGVEFVHKLLNLSYYLEVSDFSDNLKALEASFRENSSAKANYILKIENQWKQIELELYATIRTLKASL